MRIEHGGNVYDLESISGLPPEWRKRVPTPEARRGLKVGDAACVLVYVNGGDYILPWLNIVSLSASGYSGTVSRYEPHWLPPGTVVEFTAENVVKIEQAASADG